MNNEELDERFDHFPDSYYNFIVGKPGTKYENHTMNIGEIKHFILQRESAKLERLREKIEKLKVDDEFCGDTSPEVVTNQALEDVLQLLEEK